MWISGKDPPSPKSSGFRGRYPFRCPYGGASLIANVFTWEDNVCSCPRNQLSRVTSPEIPSASFGSGKILKRRFC